MRFFSKKITSSSIASNPSPRRGNKLFKNESRQSNEPVFKIKKIKICLLSRNIKKQLSALKAILKMVKEQDCGESTSTLLQTDVPGLLCDVMNNHNPSLILQIIQCLLELSKSKEFYDHRHSALVIETTCRTLRILMKSVKNISIIYFGLKLLSRILSRSRGESFGSLKQVVRLIRELLSNLMFQKVHVCVLALLHQVLKIEGFESEDLLPVLHQALYLLTLLKDNNRKRFNKQIFMVNDIVLFTISYLDCCKDENLHKSILKFVWLIICKAVIPLIKEVSSKTKIHLKLMKRNILCVSQLFSCLDAKHKTQLVNKLTVGGFLVLLPSISLQYNDEGVHKCAMLLAAQTVSQLASTYLTTTNTELESILTCLASLPADTSTWHQYLASGKASSSHLPIVTYFYFVFLCSKSFQISPSLQASVCSLLKLQTSPSLTLLKTTWLVFAVVSLSQPKLDSPSGRRVVKSTNQTLCRWLQTTAMHKVFTHHPALLLHMFSHHESSLTLRTNLMEMWLKDKSKASIKEMENLVSRNKKAAVCLLNVLSSCSSKVVNECMKIVLTVLKQGNTQVSMEIANHVWSNLSRTLTVLTSPQSGSRVTNVVCLVCLACRTLPATLDKTMLLRISYQLLTLLRWPVAEPSLASVLKAQLFKLAYVLVLKMNQLKDYRVLEAFLQDAVMMSALLEGVDSDNDMLVLSTLRLLSYLQSSQKSFNILVKESKCVDVESLLKLMTSRHGATILAALDLFVLLKKTENIKPVVVLSPHMADYLVQALYFELQNLTFRKQESWRCKTMLLEFCLTNNGKIGTHLLTQPWTHYTVQYALQSQGMKNADVLKFLMVWLTGIADRKLVLKTSHHRALCRDMLSNTLAQISSQVLECYQHDGTFGTLHLQIVSTITKIGGNIPSEVVCSLEKMFMSKALAF